ncbi:MAG TPA: chorismate mutase [Azospirillaceae bacterium]|nr:chorismate mutase [Azospirillaceae bacterium]
MSPKPDLLKIRAEIDRIDEAIHDLLIERAALLADVRRAKGPGRPVVAPGREVSILRRLVARHRGDFPAANLARIWREIISTSVRLQGPFAVAVKLAQRAEWESWDAARDYFGSGTPLVPVTSATAAVRAVTDGTVTFAVIPWPNEDGGDAWWRALLTEDPAALRIIGRLPFVIPAAGRPAQLDAAVVGNLPPEPTGDDRMLIGIDLAEEMSRGRLKDVMAAAGLDALAFWSWYDPARPGASQHLVEVADFVTGDDPRLSVLREVAGPALAGVFVVGGYAAPIVLPG